MENKKILFIVREANKKEKSKKKKTFLPVNDKGINKESNSRSKEKELYTIEIDSGSENDIQNDIKINTIDKKIKNNNYSRQNNIIKEKKLGKLYNVYKNFNFR